MTWEVRLTRSAAKDLESVPRDDRDRILEALQAMALAPYAGDTKWLRGKKGAMRRRVGDWRIIFEIDGEAVFVLTIERRSSTSYR